MKHLIYSNRRHRNNDRPFSWNSLLYPNVHIWVALNTGRQFRYHHINTLWQHTRTVKSRVLPPFHALTGRDTASTLFWKIKKQRQKSWRQHRYFLTLVANLIEQVNLPVSSFSYFRAIHSSFIWYSKCSHISEWSAERTVHQEQEYREPSIYPGKSENRLSVEHKTILYEIFISTFPRVTGFPHCAMSSFSRSCFSLQDYSYTSDELCTKAAFWIPLA